MRTTEVVRDNGEFNKILFQRNLTSTVLLCLLHHISLMSVALPCHAHKQFLNLNNAQDPCEFVVLLLFCILAKWQTEMGLVMQDVLQRFSFEKENASFGLGGHGNGNGTETCLPFRSSLLLGNKLSDIAWNVNLPNNRSRFVYFSTTIN